MRNRKKKTWLVALLCLLFLFLVSPSSYSQQNQNVVVTYGIQINGQPVVTFTPNSLQFGNQTVNTTSAAQSISMKNVGTATLTVTSLSTTAQYAETDNCVGALVVNATCTINVTFTPTATGVVNGTLTVVDNAPAGNPSTVSLSGTGTGGSSPLSATALMNLDLVTPSAPGTALTNAIFINGTAGTALSGWGSSGTTANMTVGPHIPGCPLGVPVVVAGVNYSVATISRSFDLLATSNNTFWTGNYTSGGSKKSVFSFCLLMPTSASNVMDIFNLQDSVQGFIQWLQVDTNATQLDVEVTPSPITTHINVSQGGAYWVTMLIDVQGGQACFAVYQLAWPYTQQGPLGSGPGGSQCHSQVTSSGSVNAVRIGNAEIGTSNSHLRIENIVADSVGAVFPLIPTFANPWADILSPQRAIDWTFAGASSLFENRTQCQTLACNTVTVNGASSTLAQVNAAIASASAHQFVRVPAGTYNFASMIDFTGQNNVTLRGDGADQTDFVFSGTGGCAGLSTTVCMSNGNDNNRPSGPDNTANWTAGFLPGTTTITLSAHTNLKVGNPIILDQLDDDQTNCDLGGILVAQNTTTCAGAVAPGLTGPYSLENYQGQSVRNNRGQSQIAIVTGCGTVVQGASCTSNTITISPGLRNSNWRLSQTPQAWWATTPTTGLGLEDLAIDATGAGAAGGSNPGILMKNLTNSWVRGCTIINTDRSHEMLYLSQGITIFENYHFGTQNSATISYGVEVFNASDSLIENNIFHAVTGPVKMNGPSPGTVIDYNYAINGFYTPSAGWNQPNFSWHAEGTQYELVEGNIFNIVDADNFHGTHNFATVFRNYIPGWQPACYASGATYATATYGQCLNNLNSVSLLAFARSFNIIGNVLGHAGTYTTYSSSSQTNKSIYVIGSGASETVSTPFDANVGTLLMRWGNYDTVNAANRFLASEVPSTPNSVASQTEYMNAVPPNQNLPASFRYCTSPASASCTKPLWWDSSPWPGIGPDITGGTVYLGDGVNPGSGGSWLAQSVGGHANMNPAGSCYKNIMNGLPDGTGPILTFNRVACYGTH